MTNLQFSSVAQSCLTLCYPIDGSPPGSPIPGILQARILEWVAMSFSNKRLFSSSSFSAIRVVSSVFQGYWYFSLQSDSSLCFIQPGMHDAFCIWITWAGCQYTALVYSFVNLEPVCCSMSGSIGCFLTYIQVSQEAGKVVWYSHLLKSFLFPIIHTVKRLSLIHEIDVSVFLEFSCCFYDPKDVGNLTSASSAFSKSSLNIWKSSVHILLKPCLKNFEHYFASVLICTAH